MASEGFHNILIARSKEKLEKLQHTIKNSVYDGTIIPMDLAEPEVILNELESLITQLDWISTIIQIEFGVIKVRNN